MQVENWKSEIARRRCRPDGVTGREVKAPLSFWEPHEVSACWRLPRSALFDRCSHPARGFAGSGAVLPKNLREFAVGLETAGARGNEGSSVGWRCP